MPFCLLVVHLLLLLLLLLLFTTLCVCIFVYLLLFHFLLCLSFHSFILTQCTLCGECTHNGWSHIFVCTNSLSRSMYGPFIVCMSSGIFSTALTLQFRIYNDNTRYICHSERVAKQTTAHGTINHLD